ncbi:MAG: chemotaxis protein CheA, partial [Fimbriimonadaceae bacterium]
DEQLEVLEQETLKLETDPTADRLQVIFRAAHTLKGSSRAMGFHALAELTHEMENLLDQLRQGREVTTEIADALLACLDTLNIMKASIAEGGGGKVECAALVEQLRTLSSAWVGGSPAEVPPPDRRVVGPAASPKRKKTKPNPAEAPAESAPADPGSGGGIALSALTDELRSALNEARSQGPVFHAAFELTPDCVMKYVRAFMAIAAIQEQGELLATVPDAHQLEEEHFDSVFELFFQTRQPIEELRSRFAGIAEVARFELGEWTDDTVGAADEDSPETSVAASAASAAPSGGPSSASEPAATATSKAPEGAAPAKRADSGQTVRVDVARLDELMNLVGELVIDRTRVAQIGAVLASKYDFDENIEALGETVGHITRITGDLQDQIMKARMLPIETVFNRFPRMVRDIAQKLAKEIRLDLSGGETELDRSVIEVIGDPLLHILRNSVDHGIEMPDAREAAGKPRQGVIRVSAKHQENHIVIEIEDDGAGINVEKVKAKALASGLMTQDAIDRMTDKEAFQLIFASGLSTAEVVTDVSGRGVGMDVVKSNIQKLGGIIDVDSVAGQGTKVSLRLPLTLAIIRGLLVDVGGVVYVIPLGSVIETLLARRSDIQRVARKQVIVIRGLTTPLVHLRDVFGARPDRPEERSDEHFVVIVGLAEQRIGLVVDRLIGEQEVVIKSLSRFCGDIRGISGATILGDGNVALITDVNSLFANEN